MSKTLFVSCRREDGAGTAGRLRYRLAEHLAGEEIHFEADVGPAPARHAERSRADARNARVVLVVIGRGWFGATDGHGRRRLDDRDDIVRAPVAAALESGATVIPVLIDGARLPAPGVFAEDLRALLKCRAVTLCQESFNDDVRALLGMIDRELRHERAPEPGATSVPTTLSARGMVRSREPVSRRSAFIASRVAGPVKSRRLRRAMIDSQAPQGGEAGRFEFLEWFRIYGPLTIYAVMVAFFAYLAISP